MIKTFDNGFTVGEFILYDGEEYIFTSNKQFILETAEDVFNEDFKTAGVMKTAYIPKGTKLLLNNFIRNYFGEYFEVRYNGELFYAKPCYFNYVRCI